MYCANLLIFKPFVSINCVSPVCEHTENQKIYDTNVDKK